MSNIWIINTPFYFAGLVPGHLFWGKVKNGINSSIKILWKKTGVNINCSMGADPAKYDTHNH